MKLIVERDAFADALGTAKHSTAKGPNIPILKNALLTVAGSKLHIAATNMDMRIELSVPCDVEEDDGAHAITVSVSLLSDLASRFPKGSQLALRWIGAHAPNVALSGGRASYKLNALGADMFPEFSPQTDAVRFTIPGKRLAAALNMVRWTTSDNVDQSHLNGVNVHLGSNALQQLGGDRVQKLIFAATDGYQLARQIIDLPEGLTELPNLILPNAALPEMARIANEAPDDVEIAISENLCSLTAGSTLFITKVIDATFPDYERYYPDEFTNMRVDVEALQAALMRLKTLGADNRTRADITPEEITFTVTSQVSGQADEVVPVEYEGEPVMRILSAGGVLAVLDHMQSDVALFRFAARQKPIMVNAIVGENIDYTRTFVTMPMEGK